MWDFSSAFYFSVQDYQYIAIFLINVIAERNLLYVQIDQLPTLFDSGSYIIFGKKETRALNTRERI